MLALPQKEIKAQLPKADKPSLFRGPNLGDVLKLAMARNRSIRVMAMDGFALDFAPTKLKASDWILAHERDGLPLSIGGRGPLWLLHTPAKGVKASEEEEQSWVWSVI